MQTQTSDRKRGLHDVREPIIHQDRPDLILHDSGGFEAGDESQMQAIRSFIKEKSSQANIEDRLHLIWYVYFVTKPYHEAFLAVISESKHKRCPQHKEPALYVERATLHL